MADETPPKAESDYTDLDPRDYIPLCAGPVDGDYCRLDAGHAGACSPMVYPPGSEAGRG